MIGWGTRNIMCALLLLCTLVQVAQSGGATADEKGNTAPVITKPLSSDNNEEPLVVDGNKNDFEASQGKASLESPLEDSPAPETVDETAEVVEPPASPKTPAPASQEQPVAGVPGPTAPESREPNQTTPQEELPAAAVPSETAPSSPELTGASPTVGDDSVSPPVSDKADPTVASTPVVQDTSPIDQEAKKAKEKRQKEAAEKAAAEERMEVEHERVHRNYRRMSQMGVPHEDVLAKMKADNVSEAIRETYPEQAIFYSTPRAAMPGKDTPEPCQVGPWDYSNLRCDKPCGGGVGHRTRVVLKKAEHGGKPCPALREAVECNTHSCRATLVSEKSGPSEGGDRREGLVVSWPMPRKDLHKAMDGDIHTWSYTTAAWCEHSPFWVGLHFPGGALISGIRVWKRHQAGKKRDCGTKDIEVVYTQDGENLAIGDRHYKKVSGLESGFHDTEKWVAEKVDHHSAKVFAETHNSVDDGWASLSFNTVNATVVALQIDSLDPHYNHFCIAEMQGIQDSDAAILTKQLKRGGQWSDL